MNQRQVKTGKKIYSLSGLDLSSFLSLFHILSFCSLMLIAGACTREKMDMSKLQPYEGPVLQAVDIETRYSDSARMVVKLNAPLRMGYQSGNQEFPKGILINFYNKKGENETRLTANTGFFDKSKNQYTARGNVIVTNLLENKQLKTEELHWTPADKKIFTKKFVTITTPKDIIKGQGLTATQDFSDYRIEKPNAVLTIEQ